MANRGSVLLAGQSLTGGDYLLSANGQYCAVMQDDGNFVMYWGRPPDKMIGPIWSSDTSGRGDLSASMQTSGDLMVYINGKLNWNSNTAVPGGKCYALLTDQGNLVLLQGTPDTGKGYWSTETDVTTIWVKNKGGYVAKAALDGSIFGGFDNPHCQTLREPVSRTAKVEFDVSGLTWDPFKKVELGAIRSQRWQMGGSAFDPDAQPQSGHGSF